MRKISWLFLSVLFLTLFPSAVQAEKLDFEETNIEVLENKNIAQSASIFVERSRMYTSSNSIPTSLNVSEVYNGYIYRGTIYLDKTKRLSNGNYMAYYSGNIPKTPIMGLNGQSKK